MRRSSQQLSLRAAKNLKDALARLRRQKSRTRRRSETNSETPQRLGAVRVRFAGICNTDVELLRGYHDFRGTPGHEFVGEVVDVRGISRATKDKWLGRRVVGEINISCTALGFRRVCDFCGRGLKTHCARRKVLGILRHDGAFAKLLTLPLDNLHRVPRNVTDEQAVFAEPLAAACEILAQ